MIGRQQHRLVAGDRGHRRQHVHALGPRDARNHLHRKQRDAALGAARRTASGLPSGSQGATITSPSRINSRSASTGGRIGAQPAHLQHDVGRLEQLPSIGDRFRRPPGDRRRPGKYARSPAPASTLHLAADFLESGDAVGDERDAALAGKRFFGDGDFHGCNRERSS